MVVRVKIDSETKRRMARFRDLDWAEVLRDAIRRRLELEEPMRTPVDKSRARDAAKRIDEIRARIGRSDYDSTREIRRWRDAGRSEADDRNAG